MSDMLDGVTTFVRVVETGSFALAAERMNLTRSAVGKVIVRLEKRLGVRLLNRTTRSISLTAEGELYLAHARRILGEIDGLEFAYLSGAEGPQVESRSGWDVDGVEIRVILDFGAGFIDHRGWFMNAGA